MATCFMCSSSSMMARHDAQGRWSKFPAHLTVMSPGRLFAGGLLLRVVHDYRRLVIVNLRWGAVSLRDHLLPRRGVHLLGGFAALPQVDASSDLILAKEVVLADQPWRALIVGCRLLVDRFRVFERHALWKPKADDGGDHGPTPHTLTWAQRRPAWAGCHN